MNNRLADCSLASTVLFTCFFSYFSPTIARGENWPHWRGPQNNGVSGETGLPTKFSSTENVAWKIPLSGPAGATPVVWGKNIFITAMDGEEAVLGCCSTDGKPLWKQSLGKASGKARGDEGNAASPSPSTDGQHVWAFFGNGELGCFDVSGKQVWRFNVQDRYGKFDLQFGMSSTPVLDGDRLYLQLIHSGGATVAALDKATGREVWKQQRASDARAECEHSYASPFVYRNGAEEMLLTHGADYIIAHDLKTGAELWRCGGLNPKGKYNNTLRLVASPGFGPGIIVVPSAKKGPVLGLVPSSKGDITESQSGHLWTKTSGTPDVPSPLVHDGLVYLCDEGGLLTCLDAKSGEEYYTKQRLHSARYRASPIFADGKIYCIARDGVISVIRAGKQFELLSVNDMGEDISSSLAISNGTIYVRTFDNLYAIREKGKAE